MATNDGRPPAGAAGPRPVAYDDVVRACLLVPPLVRSLEAECAARGLCPVLGREMLLMIVGSDLRQCGWSPEEVAAKAELGARCGEAAARTGEAGGDG